VASDLVIPLLTGAFGLGGVLGGVLLTNHFSHRAEDRRVANDDERRWLADRRHAYAAYLRLVILMLRDVEGIICFLSHDGTEPISDEDEFQIKESLLKYYIRWDDELQPALGEVQLLAEPKLAELADRTSWVLMELGGFIEARHTFSSFTLFLNQTRALIDTCRNVMRSELGLTEPVKTFPVSEGWPWLQDDQVRSD